MIFILASQGKDILEEAHGQARISVSHFSLCLKQAARKPSLQYPRMTPFFVLPPQGERYPRIVTFKRRIIVSHFLHCLKRSLSFAYPMKNPIIFYLAHQGKGASE
jgi:hypothetical protein